jgi:hypothetical protein
MRSMRHDYAPAISKLNALGAQHGQAAVWLIEIDKTARAISEELLPLLGNQDSLLVLEISAMATWAATRLADDVAQWLKARRP